MRATPGTPSLRAAAALLALGAAAGAGAAAERRIHVQGRIVDAEGRGLPGQSVRLFKTRRAVTLEKFHSGGQVAEAVRTSTDENGFYEIDVPKDRSFDDYYLRFHDPASFDFVKHLAPPDREITKDLKRGETLRIEVRLEANPSWPEVARRLRELGEDSPKGRILRSVGIPEKEALGSGPDGPREEWWYYSRGVVYFFRDGRGAGFREFEPVTAGAPSGAGPSAAGGGR